ncbi:GSCOCG00009323001-RA-CDS, partial [Cotesia congregata]
MSIESSFFKPTTSFPCPLCLKTFSDSTSQITHSKTCASKNKVSTRTLLEAVALQERQAEERRAIGLPAQPFAQPKRKSTFRRSDFCSEDPNVQLALALSESLKEAQDLEELDAAIALTGEEILLSSSQRQNTLKNFGFLTNKQTVEVIERPKKKKLNSQTVLQTRSQETRQRLLAERIAEVIVDNSDATWVNLEVQDELGEIKLISKVLKEILEPGRKLWNGSSGKKRGEFYYVKNLEGFIDPIDLDEDQNIDPGENFVNQNEILELDFKEKNSRGFKKNSKEEIKSKNSLEDNKKIEETPKKIVENSLSNSWRKMLNSSDLSDVIILCEDDKFIYGHSVVLWTRCQFLYRDLVKIDQVNIKNLGSIDQFKYQINWRDIDFFTALVFLEFIYCGYIQDLKVEFDKLNLMVKKYNYDELSEYLKNCTSYNYCNNCKNNESVDEEVANFLSPGNFKSNNTNLTMSPDIFDDEDSICDNFGKIDTKNDLSIDFNSLNEEVDQKEEIIDNNSKTLRRSSTCPNIEKIQSFSEDLNDTLKKTRSDLSVFIEKIQRRNARDILSDRDEDSFLPEKEAKKINKFKKVDQSITDRYKNIDLNSCNINLRRGSRFWAAKKSIEKPEKVVKKSALSIFEDDIREKVAKNQLKNFEIESDEEIKDLSNLTQSFESNDPNISMYSKYKLTHKENSIAYYRNLIKESDSEEEILNFSQKVSEQDAIWEDDLEVKIDNKKLEDNVLSQKSLLDIDFNENDFEDDDFVDEIIEKSFSLQKSGEFKGYKKDAIVEEDKNLEKSVSSQKSLEFDKNNFEDDDFVISLDEDDKSKDSFKNQSFSKEETRRISTTNQLYLQELSRNVFGKKKKNSTSLKINKEEINKEKINKEEICNYLKLNEEKVTISLNIDPKIDYSLLSTPELNRKLNLYGLKNQKRHRAVKLLTYIYESLNPLIPEEIVQKKSGFFDKQEEYKWRIDSLLRTDDEDDNNRVSVGEKNDCESLSSELPEEMDLSDDEYDQKDLKSVKETFGILLGEDDDLHRKVLMYESLPLETLHGMIKDRGVKCSVRVLMDYLNEECIGFYV